jgi:uncharacterized membrane protein YgdD (TMEM256/DUF423 family)
VQPIAFRLSAFLGFVAVTLGAFGAHGLERVLSERGMIEAWETAVLYHLVHAVVLLVLGMSGTWRPGPWVCLCLGVVLFSGSLYMIALTAARWLGPVTPIGGVCLLAGWVWLAIQAPMPRAAGAAAVS